MSQEGFDRRILWLDFTGVGCQPGSDKGIDLEAATESFIVPEGRETEEIWVETSLDPDLFKKIRKGKSPDKPDRHIATYPMRGLGIRNRRYDVPRFLGVQSLWVGVGA